MTHMEGLWLLRCEVQDSEEGVCCGMGWSVVGLELGGRRSTGCPLRPTFSLLLPRLGWLWLSEVPGVSLLFFFVYLIHSKTFRKPEGVQEVIKHLNNWKQFWNRPLLLLLWCPELQHSPHLAGGQKCRVSGSAHTRWSRVRGDSQVMRVHIKVWEVLPVPQSLLSIM